MHIFDVPKNDALHVLATPLGLIFTPSLIVIFIFGPLFKNYLFSFLYLRKWIIYNQNFKSLFWIEWAKFWFIFGLASITLFINWLIAFAIIINQLTFIAFLIFYLYGLLLLFFLTNIFLFLNNLLLGFKTGIVIFIFIFLAMFSFYSINTIFVYFYKANYLIEIPNDFFLQKTFLPFYYILLNFNYENTNAEMQLFLGDLHYLTTTMLIFYFTTSLSAFTLNLTAVKQLRHFSALVKAKLTSL
ncbi:hypothetical protein ACW95P_02485 [Candidatus Mycoplasma pogonae]